MSFPGNPDNIEEAKRQLYDRQRAPAPLGRSPLSDADQGAKRGWSQMAKNPGRFLEVAFLKKVLIVAAVFFVLMAIAALIVSRTGSNVVSSGNVELGVTGPAATAAGTPVDFQVSISNQNSIALSSVTLTVEYPKGTRSPLDPTQTLSRDRLAIGTIRPGETVNRSIKATLFGENGSQLMIKISTEYRLSDSNAIFSKAKDYPVNIDSSPLSLDLQLPSEANADQDLPMTIEITPNSQATISDALVRVDYPSGFTFTKATPSPTRGNNLWALGPIVPGHKQTIKLTGRLTGQNEDQKSVHVAVGTIDKTDATNLDTIYASLSQVVTIKRSYVSLTPVINDNADSEDYIGSSGQVFRTEIEWNNNLPEKLQDGEMSVTLSGDALDQSSVTPRQGFYQSSSNTILWNKQSQPELGSIEAGATGKSIFEFSTLPLGGSGVAKNPVITMTIKFKAQRQVEGAGVTPILSEAMRQIRLNSSVQLAAKALYHGGPLVNSGPLPPKVDQETTYTVIWSVVNSSNDLNDTKVSATLPPYVRFTNVQSPMNESLSFNADAGGGGTMTWNIGSLRAGTGTGGSAREVAFQIAFKPSLSQVDQTPELTSQATLSAADSFTKQAVELTTKRDIDTSLSADPDFKDGDEKVVK